MTGCAVVPRRVPHRDYAAAAFLCEAASKRQSFNKRRWRAGGLGSLFFCCQTRSPLCGRYRNSWLEWSEPRTQATNKKFVRGPSARRVLTCMACRGLHICRLEVSIAIFLLAIV